MKRLIKLGLCAVLGVGVAAGTMVPADEVFAQARKGEVVIPATPMEPPTVKNKEGIELTPTGIRWGMTSKQLAEFYDGEIERSYKPQFDRAQAGPQTERLTAAVANAQQAFRRSKLEFGALPTGIDATPLKGEYTYQNKESMMKYTRSASSSVYFFFIQDKLWKIYDEVLLGQGKPLGATYEQAATTLTQRYSVAGRLLELDYVAGRNFTEIDWQDPRTHLRLLDRSGLQIAAMVYEDRVTLNNLSTLRANKPVEDSGVDPSVEALMRPPTPEPAPKEAPKKK